MHPCQVFLANCTGYSDQIFCATVLKLSLVSSTALEARSEGSVLEGWETKKILSIPLSPVPASADRTEALGKENSMPVTGLGKVVKMVLSWQL